MAPVQTYRHLSLRGGLAAVLTSLTLAVSVSAGAQQSAPEAPARDTSGVSHPVRGPSLALAWEAAQAAIQTCKARDYLIGVTIVDDTGGVRLSVASDGAPPQGSNGSRRTAMTSAVFKESGAALGERAQKDPAFAAKISENKDWLPRAGSLLLKSGDKIVGAIAVEGVPHDFKLDVACAQAGVDKIAGRLK